jgi:hypothetical protein
VQERELSGRVGIENRLHWVPDIAFWEGESWARGGGERYLLTVIAG